MNKHELDRPNGFQRRIPPASTRERYQGCLLGGAVGDALGAPVEFLSRAEILRRFGSRGLTDMAPAYGKTGSDHRRYADDIVHCRGRAAGLRSRHAPWDLSPSKRYPLRIS